MYSNSFYEKRKSKVYSSALEIVPILIDLIHPKSVIDIGSGTGTWLSVFLKQGITDIQGVDGNWIDYNQLEIPKEFFSEYNLEKINEYTPVRRFDLSICLEVAEHLPENVSDNLIDKLTSLSEIIYFSAAIPFQGGNEHKNEQWQSYWANKFKEKEYVPIDCIRPKVCNNPRVSYWYAQNSLLYLHRNTFSKYPNLDFLKSNEILLDYVHPNNYKLKCEKLNHLKNKKSFFSKLFNR